jgi:hypothetical protein
LLRLLLLLLLLLLCRLSGIRTSWSSANMEAGGALPRRF